MFSSLVLPRSCFGLDRHVYTRLNPDRVLLLPLFLLYLGISPLCSTYGSAN
jgi:hypothetical protein